jgi:hypothetical protein
MQSSSTARSEHRMADFGARMVKLGLKLTLWGAAGKVPRDET